MSAPFYVGQAALDSRWGLWMRCQFRFVGWFDTQVDAINHAYRNWPWWP